MTIVGILIGAVIGALFSGVIIWLVGKLHLGMEVDGFKPAFIAAIVIAIISAVVHWVWQTVFNYTPPAGWSGAIINLVTSAIVLQTAGNWVKGIRVKGFTGALVASLAIAVIQLLLGLLLVNVIS